jgi:putative peptidoglycan lipid II flippase
MTSKRQMVWSSMVVGFFSLLGSLTGILVETSIAAKLGLSKSSDTFYAAFTIPYVVTNLLRTAGQYSMVPFFSSLEARHTPEELWRGFSYAVSILFVGLTGIAALGALAAPWLIRGLAPGFTPSESLLASELCRWLFLILLPAGIAETIRSFLFSQHRFAVAASGNFFRNATVIVSILLTFRRLGFYSIVLGYLAGYVVQLAVLGGELLIAFPVRYSFTLAGSGEAFRNLRGTGAAQVAAALEWQGVVVVERMIASFLPPGVLTALAYGMKIMATLSELMAGSVGTAALPTLARAFARRQAEEVRRAVGNAFRIVLLWVCPGMVFCLMLPVQVVRLIFERGNFTPQMTALMGRVFFCYSLSLLLYAFVRIITIYLFAQNEAVAFWRLATLLYGLNVALDLLYVGVFRWLTAGIPLALATSLAVTCALAGIRNIGGIRQSLDRTAVAFFWKTMAATALAALCVWGLRSALAAPQTGLGNFIFLLETCSAGTLVFFATLLALGAIHLSQVALLWKRADGT